VKSIWDVSARPRAPLFAFIPLGSVVIQVDAYIPGRAVVLITKQMVMTYLEFECRLFCFAIQSYVLRALNGSQGERGHVTEFGTKYMGTCGTALAVQVAYQVRVNVLNNVY
jgi:hypothetical protein